MEKLDAHTDNQIRDILSSSKTIAVVGISTNPEKPAHYSKYLQSKGYDIIPINPNAEQILGKQCLKDVKDVKEAIDVVQIFRPSDQVLPFVKNALLKNPKMIWLQKGIHNAQAEELALEKGIDIVFNRCMFEEHRRLFD
ncbi:CoA-binding protein [Nitrosopumilus sp.]|uniref:CoA-binding protein n=1 Tax=Nitrosopumilus sp. TaxID=2024843 RepID=UPI003B5C6FEF